MEAVTAEVAEVEEAVPPAAAALPQEAAAVEAEDQCADKQKRMVIEPSFFLLLAVSCWLLMSGQHIRRIKELI